MNDPTAPRIFVTYDSRDLAFARELQAVLQAAGLSLYQDLADLEDAPDRWWQIETTIKVVDHVILVLTSKALRSHYIPIEWRLALREGKNVWLVPGPGRFRFTGLPHWMKRAERYDIAVPESRERLIAGLRTPAMPRRVPFTADALPEGFIQRPEKVGEIKRRPLDSRGAPVAGTVALHGAGGVGKTALANALCHDPDIRDAFDGGILRVALGEKPDDLVRTMSGLIFMLDGKRSDVSCVKDAKTKLAEALDGRRCLLVIDDARRLGDLEAFLRLGRRDYATRLITTREDGILPPNVECITVDAMTSEQAQRMLVRGLPEGTLTAHHPRLAPLAARLDESPLLLGLANGVLRRRVARGASPEASIGYLEQSLEERRQRHQTAASTLELSLEQLQGEERDRFIELSAFAEDAEIPIQAALGLWQQTAQLGQREGEALLMRLDELSLLFHVDRDKGTFRLNDVLRALLRARQPTEQLAALDRRLMAHFRSNSPGGDLACLSDVYALRHVIGHLRNGGEGAAADALLLDPRWMRTKLESLGVQPLLSDYAGYLHDTAQGLVGATLTLIADSIVHRPRELAAQLVGRLTAGDAPGLEACLLRARALLTPPTLLPLRPTLALPIPELRRFEGHGEPVTCAAVLPDGRRALSGSKDKTLRLWDIESGAALRCLNGHGGAVTCVAALADGRRALSGSDDNSLRLWDIEAGAELRCFEGHEQPVTGMAVLADRRCVLSASKDNTLRLWDIEAGTELRRFEGHEDWVNCVALLTDGRRALSASDDSTVRLWDIDSGAELRRFEEHDGVILSMSMLADGRRALSGFNDNTLCLWDLEAGTVLQRFEGHEGWVTSVAMLPDGRHALSASGDNTIRLWDVETGAELRRFGGHDSDEWHETDIPGVAVLVDGRRALSGSDDNTLRLWDVGSAIEPRRFKGHEGSVTSLSVLSDERRALSGAQDDTFRLWDIASGVELRRFGGHDRGATDVALLPDERRALSACYDYTISLWDIWSGAELRRYGGHKGVVTCVAVLPKGRRALSGSHDGTLRLWNIASGARLQRLDGHSDYVTCVALLPDGRHALSGSFDDSLRLWDIESGTQLRYFEGHRHRVECVALLTDARRALSGSDDCTLRLWDIESGAELRRFEGHRNQITCVAVLPDGRHALSGSFDNSLRLWDIESGAELACLTFDKYVGAIAWSEPLKVALVGDGVGTVHTIGIA